MYKNKGFTLIELLVVIAIIGLLAAGIIPSLILGRQKSRDAARAQDIGNIRTALELFFDSNKKYPAGLDDLVTANLLPVIPRDPLAASGCTTGPNDGTPCRYYYAVSPTTANPSIYHLGASLENSAHVALSNDKDCVSTSGSGCPATSYVAGTLGATFNGADGTGCDGTTGRACYDVIP